MPAPANDNIANATDLAAGTTQVTGDMTDATAESSEVRGSTDGPNPGTTPTSARTIWYRWIAPSSDPATFTTVGSTADTVLTVYRAKTSVADPVTAVTSVDAVYADDDGGGGLVSSLTFTPTAYVVYYVQIFAFNSPATYGFVLNYPSPASTSVPPNNNLANAADLVPGTTQVTANMAGANAETSEVRANVDGPNPTTQATTGRTVWYRWTAPSSSPATFTTVGSTADTLLTVYLAKSGVTDPVAVVTDLDAIYADDDSGGGLASSLTFTPTAGLVYYLQILAFTSSRYDYVLNYPLPASGGTTHNASVTLDATGSLSGAGTRETATTATLAATGALTGTAARETSTTATLAATGTLTATGVRTQDATATLAATGTLTTAGERVQETTAVLAGTGTLTASAVRTQEATALLAATGDLTAAGLRSTDATATLAATGTLTADGEIPGLVQHVFTDQTPTLTDQSDGTPGITFGTTVRSEVPGYAPGVRWYTTDTVSGTYIGALYQVDAADDPTPAGTELAQATFVGTPSPSGWNSITFDDPVPITAGVLYRAAVFSGDGRYVYTANLHDSDIVNGDLIADAAGDDPVGLGTLRQATFTIASGLAYPATGAAANGGYLADWDFVADDLPVEGSATLAATGGLTAAGDRTAVTTATFAATGELAATAVRTADATGTLAAVGTLSGTATLAQAATVTLAAVGGLTGTAALATAANGTLAAVGTLTAVATVVPPVGSSPTSALRTTSRPATLATASRPQTLSTGSPPT